MFNVQLERFGRNVSYSSMLCFYCVSKKFCPFTVCRKIFIHLLLPRNLVHLLCVPKLCPFTVCQRSFVHILCAQEVLTVCQRSLSVFCFTKTLPIYCVSKKFCPFTGCPKSFIHLLLPRMFVHLLCVPKAPAPSTVRTRSVVRQC